MKLRALVLPCLLSAGLFAPAAHAQRQGTVEFGAYVRKNWFGQSYGLHQVAGAGVRLGFFPIRHVELEADGVYTPTRSLGSEDKINVMRFSGLLLFHVPTGDHSAFILGGGVMRQQFRRRPLGVGNATESYGHETAPTALAGMRFGLGDVVSIRLDGTLDRVGKPNPLLTYNIDHDWHYGFQAGLAFLFGNRGESFRGPSMKDSDNDGVIDTADQCPNTPNGTQVNSSGCPMAAMNAAADSLRMKMHADSMAMQARADSVRAAAEAEARAAAARMQAQKDSIDAAARASSARISALEDSLRAARTAGARASLRDSLNAARMRDSLRVLMSTPNAKLILQGVNFATNSATLVQSSRFVLDEVAKSLVANPDVRLEVAGHTDNTGGRALNERLSNARAASVKDYLIAHGVAADRLESKGYAFDRPIASNKTVAGRAINRRTELNRLN